MAKKNTKQRVSDEQPLKAAEVESEIHGEAVTESAALDTGSQLEDEEQLDAAAAEVETETDVAVPAEVAAVHTDTPTAKQASGETPARRVNVRPPLVGIVRTGRRKGPHPRVRSKKYQVALGDLKPGRRLSLTDALDEAKGRSYTKFDGTIELHVRVAKGKSDQSLRGLIQLPHGTGKELNAAILTEALIDQIATAGRTEYDVLIAPKSLMPKVATIAKILGPQGKMPTPKAGTVSENPEEALKAIQSGRIEYKADAGGVIHLPIGKVSWDTSKLADNARVVLAPLPATQLLSITIAATMGPGIAVDITDL